MFRPYMWAIIRLWLDLQFRLYYVSDVWLNVHRNSVLIRNQLVITFVLSFISLLQVAQHVSGNHVPIFRS